MTGITGTPPTGKMVFTVLGAVAELERSLIAERVRAGLRNAKAKGKKLGRPRVAVNPFKIASLRAQGQSWASISEKLDIGGGYGSSGCSEPCQKPCSPHGRKGLILNPRFQGFQPAKNS